MADSSMVNQMMEYDRSNVMFAPDGRLIQVEYAKKTVSQGSIALGFTCKDGVFIIADKRLASNLMTGAGTEKIMQIDSHMGAAMSGLISDGRILIESAQYFAQNNRIVYDTPVDVLGVVKYLCNFKQSYTQFGGYRPFGVSIMIAGYDDKPRLFVTEPSGIFFGYRATAIGENDEEAKNLIRKQYRDDLTLKEGLKIGLKIMAQVVPNFDITKIDAMCISEESKEYTKLSTADLKKYYSK
jgi:proteasome alpha subunit